MTGVIFFVTVLKGHHEKKIRKNASVTNPTGDRLTGNNPAVIYHHSESNIASKQNESDDTNTRKSHSENFVFDTQSKDDEESCRDFIQNESDIASVYMTRRGSIPTCNNSETSSIKGVAEKSSIEELLMEDILKEILKNLNILDAAWSDSLENTHWQVSFSVSGRIRSEQTIKTLRAAGFGQKNNTTLCVIPCSLRYHAPALNSSSKNNTSSRDDPGKQTTWGAFVQSVRARQTVAQVVEQIKSQTELTFDFIFLLVVSAIVAAIGLAENSTVFLVASMLISPLMGPIMASTFGTAIREIELLKMGVKHELFGLFLALVIGFLFGLVICSIDGSYGNGKWPSDEITSRCDLRSLWVGALIAIPSGAAVAIAVLSDNTASLVGVAISASLLPPAVNAGLLWAMSILRIIFVDDDHMFKSVVITNYYSSNPATELAICGSISLCITLVNIICIYVAGIVVYKIKEVAPLNTTDEQFWKHGIKAVRDFNKALPEEKKNQMNNSNDIEENISDVSDGEPDSNVYDLDLIHYGLLDRIRYPRNSHSTWSPQILSRRVSAKEFREFYHQFNEDSKARKPRLSFPVNQLPGYSRLKCDDSTSISDNPVQAKKSESKFTVIPVDEHEIE